MRNDHTEGGLLKLYDKASPALFSQPPLTKRVNKKQIASGCFQCKNHSDPKKFSTETDGLKVAFTILLLAVDFKRVLIVSVSFSIGCIDKLRIRETKCF